MRIAGIDPGKTGGIAIIEDGELVEAYQMPVTGNDIDVMALRQMILDTDEVWIEQVHAMPGQGVVSMFSFGKSFGTVIGVAQCLGRPVHFVRPQVWKKSIQAASKGGGKDEVVAWVKSTFPEGSLLMIPRGCRVPHIGISDAIAIAYHGSLNTLRPVKS